MKKNVVPEILTQNTKRRLAIAAREMENLKWENEVLALRFEKVGERRTRQSREEAA